jgi:hypothetical protein
MRLSKTATWLAGILIMFLLLGLDRGYVFLTSEKATGEVIGFHTNHGRKMSSSSPMISFDYDGYTYTFTSARFSYSVMGEQVQVLFDADDPTDVYENTFGGFWAWGFIYIAIALVPWSAAALSFVGSNERLVIGRKKIWLEKIHAKDEY